MKHIKFNRADNTASRLEIEDGAAVIHSNNEQYPIASEVVLSDVVERLQELASTLSAEELAQTLLALPTDDTRAEAAILAFGYTFPEDGA